MTGKMVALRPVFTVLIGVLGALVADSAMLAAKSRPAIDKSAEIARIEAYLNSVRSVEAGFLQISSGGHVAEGKLYLQKPKQLRLDYRPPATVQIYANGYWLAFIDTELEEISQVPLSSTPAGILVRERVALSGDITVTRIEKRDDQIRVHLVQTKEPDAGKLVMSFSDRPLKLQNWIVTDAQGIRTQVSLINARFNHRIDKKFFEFDEERFENSDSQ
jgi:outer membrane lipoprotein-sorting protein